MRRAERRSAPRITSRLPLTLADHAHEFVARTKNLSASGAYCTVRQFVPPMTKLQIRLELTPSSRPVHIACLGVVVRTEPASPRPQASDYHIAILFQDLTERERSAIARYVQQQLHTSSLSS